MATWYVVTDDLIGGVAVALEDKPCSELHPGAVIANFVRPADAEQIVLAHNEYERLVADYGVLIGQRDALEVELAAWRKLARARGRLLVAYRVAGRTPGRAIGDALAATRELQEMGVDVDG